MGGDGARLATETTINRMDAAGGHEVSTRERTGAMRRWFGHRKGEEHLVPGGGLERPTNC